MKHELKERAIYPLTINSLLPELLDTCNSLPESYFKFLLASMLEKVPVVQSNRRFLKLILKTVEVII